MPTVINAIAITAIIATAIHIFFLDFFQVLVFGLTIFFPRANISVLTLINIVYQYNSGAVYLSSFCSPHACN